MRITEKVLITVKTYPTLSTKYDELVCTAGFREDGSWVRLYPIPFRKLDYSSQYKKYQWVNVEMRRNFADARPESYKPVNFNKIEPCGEISTGKDRKWTQRKRIVLQNVYTDLTKLVNEAKDRNKCTSLAVFKPALIKRFNIKSVDREWDPKTLKKLEDKARQKNLFQDSENPFKVVRKLPFQFSFTFEDETGRESTMMIEDWEIGQLYWNMYHKFRSEEKACLKVKEKYFDDFALTKDLYLYLGTLSKWHFVAPQPFVIIGTFHPPIDNSPQLSLF